ncbi:hypothetical protein DFH05DRAFT_477718 [Lentinula detonsa]|uniref:Uncharacterized protein n=1 Tax=Lentinula detonsa TaxID=2804962 RepID=A0A9W8NSF4_9AGAR|nr:hypothetical protein DFH05DRAFT_477718 [Lentinula detonsa]
MTPEETALLASIGVTLYWNYAQLALICTMYGFYLLLAFIALVLLLKSGIPSTRPRQYLLIVTLLTLGINTWGYIISVGIELVRTKYVFAPLAAGLRAQVDLANAKAEPWSRMSIWASNLNLFIGDATVIWRAWAIYTGHRVAQWFLVALMAFNGAMLIITSACDVAALSDNQQTAVLAISVTSIWTSLVTNLIATIFIGVKLWDHHKTMKPLYNGKQRSHVERLMLLLVESGTVLGILQLLYAIFLTLEDFTIPTQNEIAAYLMFNSVFSELVPMYSMAVIILVKLERAPLVESFHLSLGPTSNLDVAAKSRMPNENKMSPSHLSTIRFVEGDDLNATSATTPGSSSSDDHIEQSFLQEGKLQ